MVKKSNFMGSQDNEMIVQFEYQSRTICTTIKEI